MIIEQQESSGSCCFFGRFPTLTSELLLLVEMPRQPQTGRFQGEMRRRKRAFMGLRGGIRAEKDRKTHFFVVFFNIINCEYF